MEILQGANETLKRYVIEDYVYKRNKFTQGVSYLICVAKGCPGKCHFQPESAPVHSSPHNHEPDASLVSRTRLKSFLIEKAGSDLLSRYRLIYLDGIARFPLGAQFLGYPEAVRIMKKERKRKLPRPPVSIIDIETILNEATNILLRQDLLQHDMEPLLVRDGVMLLVDDTYKTVPSGVENAYQLLTIHAVEFETEGAEVYACAFAIMSNKTKDAYVAAFDAISNQVGGMNPVKVMCDFDAILRDACRESFYGAEVVGCWFHYTQAVRRHAVTVNHLQPLINQNANAKVALQRMMALPLSPSDHRCRAAFDDTVAFIQGDANLRNRFAPFIAYMERQWFGAFQPEDYCVFRQEIRTNNNVERFNLDFLQAIGGTHPTFWHFYDALRRVALLHIIKRQQVENHVVVRRPLRPKYRRLNEQLRHVWGRLDNGEITIVDFIHRAGHMVGGLAELRN